MHAFNLAMQSVVSEAFFAAVITKCQKVVTFTCASHAVLAAVLAAAQGLNIQATPTSANKTRFTSSARCVRSVNDLLVPYKSVILQQPDLFRSATGREVVNIMSEEHFAAWCGNVGEILLPFEQVIMAIQRDRATLGDVTRYWIYLSIQLGLVCIKLHSCK